MTTDCESCENTGWVLQESPDSTVRTVAERCSCALERADEWKVRRARIPRHFQRASFDNFKADEVTAREALELCRAMCENYPRSRRGVLLMGQPGVGKTHLAVASVRSFLEKGVDALFYDFRELLDDLRSTYDSNTGPTESSVLNRVFDAEVLVLDELGSEKLTDWVREITHRIILRRYNEDRLTILTTNYLDEELFSEPPDPLETLKGRIGHRLRSRLYEMCDTVCLAGDDFRRQRHDSLPRRTAVLLSQSPPLSPPRKPHLEPAPFQSNWKAAPTASLPQPSKPPFELAWKNLPEPQRELYFRRARESMRLPMAPIKAVEQRAMELFRDELEFGYGLSDR